HGIQNLLIEGFSVSKSNYLFFLLPLVGIVLTVVYKVFFNKGKLGGGIPNLLYTIYKKSSLVHKDKMYSQLISSGITVGFGGSVGLEAPIVSTGAAFGSNLGRLFHVGYKKRTLLIGCGAAAAIGGIFGAPIAGVIFVLEVLLLELTIPAFIPLLISAVTGTLVSTIAYGEDVIFHFELTESFHYTDTLFYALLGILCGLVSFYFHRNIQVAKRIINQVNNHWARAIIGGLALGILIFVFPPLYGEGYDAVKALLASDSGKLVDTSLFFKEYSNEWFILAFAIALILVKVFASGFTMAAGGNGGVFAPTMFTGALTGFVLSKAINLLNLNFNLSEKNFVMVGMAGVASGLMHAPLTSIFLIAEVASGYELIIPLMIVSALSYATVRYFEKNSHYTHELAKKGQILFHDKDKTVLNILKLEKLVETEFTAVDVNGTLRDITEAVSNSKRNIYPVLGANQKYYGVVALDDIRQLMFKQEALDTVTVKDIMHRPQHYVTYGETMEDVMKKFEESGYWNLPVLEGEKYIGFLSKSKIFGHYRNLLKKETRTDTNIID
ncbi:MAG: chloride channel protein, partial [Bacteroidetes bacterium]|nr:chloride channel protein [Bacteroidota bacterium]